MKTVDDAMPIDTDDLAYHPLSFADPSGRLFWWKGQLYRGMTEHAVALCRELFSRGIVDRLVAKGLIIDTELSYHRLGLYPVVLRHREIPFISYPHEWCGHMLKDAALLVLGLQRELAREGLALQDAHPWNIAFDGSRPVWVDFGSIVRLQQEGWPAVDEFVRFFLYPLQLMAQGHGRIARWLLRDFDYGVLESDVRALTSKRLFNVRYLLGRVKGKAKEILPAALQPVYKRIIMSLKQGLRHQGSRSQSRADFLSRLWRDVEAIDLILPRGEWAEYYKSFFPAFSPTREWTTKHRSVYDVLSAHRPPSVLDVGSNRGWYAQLAAHLGSQVVAFDTDESSLTRLYLDCRTHSLPILPLVMDFRNPTPGYGLINSWFPSATHRLRCEMVMALALVHHLVFKQHLNFEQIAAGLSAFSKKWLLVEFIPDHDPYVKDWWSSQYSWYTVENFTAALGQRFRIVKSYPSYPDGRVLILCEVSPAV